MSSLDQIQLDEEKFVSLLGKLIGEAKYLQVCSISNLYLNLPVLSLSIRQQFKQLFVGTVHVLNCCCTFCCCPQNNPPELVPVEDR